MGWRELAANRSAARLAIFRRFSLSRGACAGCADGRVLIRHYWAGALSCDKPMYGIWGGPPQSGGADGDYHPVARPAGDLAGAPRGKVKLREVVQSALPALGLPGVTRPLRKGEQR